MPRELCAVFRNAALIFFFSFFFFFFSFSNRRETSSQNETNVSKGYSDPQAEENVHKPSQRKAVTDSLFLSLVLSALALHHWGQFHFGQCPKLNISQVVVDNIR